MKTINIKLLSLFLLTHLLTGCLPDSLTKFKTGAVSTQGTVAAPVIKDASGNVIDPASIVYPKYFNLAHNGNIVTTFNAQVGTNYPLGYFTLVTTGTLATSAKDSIFKTCEQDNLINNPLPNGLQFDPATCAIYGTPIDNSIVAGNNGQPKVYSFHLRFLNVKGQTGTDSSNGATCSGSECTINMNMTIGAYYVPASLSYTQNDKIGLVLGSYLVDINKFTLDDNNVNTHTDVLTAQTTGTMGSVQIINAPKNTLYTLRAIPLKVDSTAGFTVGTVTGTGTNIATYDEINLVTAPGGVAWNINDTVTSGSNYTGKISYVNGSGTLIKVIRSNLSTGSIDKNSVITNTTKGNLTSSATVASLNLYDTLYSTTNTSDFNIGHNVYSGSTYSGVVTFVDSNKTYIRVKRLSTVSSTITNGIIVDSSPLTPVSFTIDPTNSVFASVSNPPKFGRIISIDNVNQIIRVIQSTDYNSNFSAGDTIGTTNSNISTMVNSIDPTDGFKIGDNIDNDIQFYSHEATVFDLTQIYAAGKAIQPIAPIITSSNSTNSPSNGVTYSISPALPAGLHFNEDANGNIDGKGMITGTFQGALEPTTFKLTATNPLGSTSYTFNLAAIYSPQDLSYTTQQLIPVKNASAFPNSIFNEGEKIFQPIIPPATESIRGTISYRLGSNDMLAIDTINGSFSPGASIDSGRSFISEKAYIAPDAITYDFNLILDVSDVSYFVEGGYISSRTGALARIIHIDGKRLYVQFLTPQAPLIKTFSDKIEVDNKYPYIAGDIMQTGQPTVPVTITQITSPYYAITPLSNVNINSYSIGNEVTAKDSSSFVGGYIYNNDGTSFYVSNISKTPDPADPFTNVLINPSPYPYFKHDQSMAPSDTWSSTDTIDSVSNDNYIAINRGDSFQMRPQLSFGTNLTFSVSPALPTGISLDPSTGLISGNPTYLTPKKTYIITAKNLLGSSSYAINLEVRDYFRIEEISNSTSYIFHKAGATRNTRACQINATDIKNGTGQQRDIMCYLDAQEEDLHFNPLVFKGVFGSGVCEYMQYAPFAFQQYAPNNTSVGLVNYVPGCDPGAGAMGMPKTTSGTGGTYTTTAPTTNSLVYCPSNYSSIQSSDPNCDSSSFTVRTWTTSLDSTGTVCKITTSSDNTNSCGGNMSNCMAGPIRDLLTDSQINLGYRSVIYSVSGGFSTPIIHKSPDLHNDLTNLRVANGTINNACATNTADAATFETYANSAIYADMTSRPFANKSTPFYVFNCLDAAQDIKARIRIVIRDWNKAFKITDGIDQLNPAYMNISTNDPFGVSYNRYYDWDDNYNSPFPANYTGGACAVKGGGTDYAFPGDNI